MDNNGSDLDYYRSESSESEEDSQPAPLKKLKRVPNDWEKVEVFETFESAKCKIKSERKFVYKSSTDICNGKKMYYNCAIQRCPAKIHLYLPGGVFF